MRKPRITVVGSSNTDLIIKMPRLPVPGETVLGNQFVIAAGGKGANQAVAAARLGAMVTFVARLGKDDFGNSALTGFEKEKINTEFVFRDEESPSGVALIFVGETGENMIAAAQGANARLSREDIDKADEAIKNADIVVLQLETTMDAVIRTVEIASERHIPIILNPAPGRKLGPALVEKISYLTPNETEAEILTGVQVVDQSTAERAGAQLLQRGAQNVIITMGKSGAVLVNSAGSLLVPAFQVKPVDTTAAGDAFNGGLAYAIAVGQPLEEAMRFANAVAALAVTRMGAQPSMPAKTEVDGLLAQGL